MLTIKLVWSFLKKYWWVGAAIIAFVFFKRWTDQAGDLAKTLENIQKAHDEEIKAIKAADEERRLATIENIKKMQERLELVEQHYIAAQEELNNSKRAEIKKILEKNANDPVALAEKLSETTGFKIILPN